ncbi:hypothetical protein ElP_71800 (plasmid) [Tautonia plasticadhaerens]|uniref:Uncharacterized protein n=1 Tax=Tautonia plasticadhaerens TaxID=2527974 RepID=A0A518HEM7_9BACT|nr:hypothetical protein ElP_71800 [Tautonia plasticadhaerens]
MAQYRQGILSLSELGDAVATMSPNTTDRFMKACQGAQGSIGSRPHNDG